MLKQTELRISFSHYYPKIQGLAYHWAELLDVIPVSLERLSKKFLDYDTGCGLYKLPDHGDYLLLLFSCTKIDRDRPHIFTTLRRSTPDKRKYYEGNIGNCFQICLSSNPDA
jgi:hypothetical protein